MNIWLQIAGAAVLVMMLFYMYPAAKHWMQNSPKAKKGDWMAAAIPLILVIGFVFLLIAMVR
jgi:archaellum biogenesis protein FlaJ (TadC family)